MANVAFKVPIPTNYNNVTEAKLFQKGKETWVQLPPNMVQDKRMARRTVYMDDYNKNKRVLPTRCRNVKAKVVTRHHNPHPSEDFLGFRGDALRFKSKDCMDLGNDVGSKSERKRMYQSLSTSFDGIPSGSNYSRMKSIKNGPIAALLPVMNGSPKSPDLPMDDHYVSPRRMSSARSYNDKAREALPGLGKWNDSGHIHDVHLRKHSTTISGGDFLENPLLRADEVNHEAMKKSVSIRTPSQLRQRSGSRHRHEGSAILNSGRLPVSMDPPSLENSGKRHELEILTRVDPKNLSLDSNALGHLYQPLGSENRPGYSVVGNSYEHENGAFFHTGPTRSFFNIAPDWVSERKKPVVIRH